VPGWEGVASRCLPSISAKKLSDTWLVSLMRRPTVIDRSVAISFALAPAWLTPADPSTRIPRRLRAASSFFAANSGGRVWNALPFSRAKPRL
jgi:hypothetical protein